MDFLFIYLTKSSLSLILLYLSYVFFFRKEAYFKFSRYLLLLTVLLAIILPLLPYNANKITSITSLTLNEVIINSNIAVFTLKEVVISAKGPWSLFSSGITFGSALLIIYLLGVFFKIAQFSLRIIQLRSIIKSSKTFEREGLKFVYTAKGTPTYSFLNWIFIDPDLLKNEAEFTSILSHEKIHAEQGHTYDLFLAEIVTIIQWFNPFAYLFKNIIKENHEYLTDSEVISDFQDAHTYQMVLLQHSSIIKTNTLTHNFSYSLLKRRLNIMRKKKNPLSFSIRLLLLSGSLALIFFACSSPDSDQTKDTKEKSATSEPVFLVTERMAEFPGGEEALISYLSSSISYPEEAKKEGIEGKVFVNFVVEKDGSIGEVKIKRGIGGGCDEEAIRVIKEMPKWEPATQRNKEVRLEMNLPINFKLNETEVDKNQVFLVVEVMPEYPGGEKAMYSFISNNLNYPEIAKKAGTQGRIFVTFVVEKDGSITDVQVLRGIGDGCDEEAIRVIKAMPKWTPGQQRGEAVRVAYRIPIKFALQ